MSVNWQMHSKINYSVRKVFRAPFSDELYLAQVRFLAKWMGLKYLSLRAPWKHLRESVKICAGGKDDIIHQAYPQHPRLDRKTPKPNRLHIIYQRSLWLKLTQCPYKDWEQYIGIFHAKTGSGLLNWPMNEWIGLLLGRWKKMLLGEHQMSL